MFRHPGGWRPFYALVALSLLIHILLDWITGYGTQLLAPLSDHRFALGTTFIIDPVLASLFLVGAALPALFKSSRLPAPFRSDPLVAGAATLLAVAWISWEAVMQQQARDIGHAYARSQGWPQASVTAEARPIAPWNWTVIVKEGERYHYAHLHLRDHPVAQPGHDANWLLKALADFKIPRRRSGMAWPHSGWERTPNWPATCGRDRSWNSFDGLPRHPPYPASITMSAGSVCGSRTCVF